MTITTTYMNDLSRVRIALSSIANDGPVVVQRSANATGFPWETVRGGTALPVIGGEAQLDDYEFFADVETFYRVLRLNPGLQLPGGSGDYASTPDAAALDITGDIDLRVVASAADWSFASDQTLVAKWATSNLSYRMIVNAGRLIVQISPDGTGFFTSFSTTTIPVQDNREIGLRAVVDVNDGFGNHVVRFYYGDTIDGPWKPLGQPVVTNITVSIFSGTAPLTVGASGATGTTERFTGTVRAVKVVEDPFGTPAEVANPDFAAETDGTGSFSDDAGLTWTVNGGADIFGEDLETDSIVTDLDGMTWLKSIKYPALNRPIGRWPAFRPVQRSSRTGAYNIKGRVPPIGVHDAWTSQWWTIETVMDSLALSRDLDLCIAAGGTYFIHVPAEFENECFTNPVSGMPGGYVYILNSTMSQTVEGSHAMRWVLPVRVIAPPAPEIYGTTLTWRTVERLYGSWNALRASNPTWRDLWEQIMDPDDAVVL